jgi:hypothetical protein
MPVLAQNSAKTDPNVATVSLADPGSKVVILVRDQNEKLLETIDIELKSAPETTTTVVPQVQEEQQTTSAPEANNGINYIGPGGYSELPN